MNSENPLGKGGGKKRKRDNSTDYSAKPDAKKLKPAPLPGYATNLIDVVLGIAKNTWKCEGDFVVKIREMISYGQCKRFKHLEESINIVLDQLAENGYLKKKGNRRRSEFFYDEEYSKANLPFPIKLDHVNEDGTKKEVEIGIKSRKRKPPSSVFLDEFGNKKKYQQKKKVRASKGKDIISDPSVPLEYDTPLWLIVLKILKEEDRDLASRDIIEQIQRKVRSGELPKFKHLRKDVSSRLTQLVKRRQVKRKGKRGSFKFKYLCLDPNSPDEEDDILETKKKKQTRRRAKPKKTKRKKRSPPKRKKKPNKQELSDVEMEVEEDEEYYNYEEVPPTQYAIDDPVDSPDEEIMYEQETEMKLKKNERSLSSIILNTLNAMKREMSSGEVVKKIEEKINQGQYYPIKHLSDSVSSQLSDLVRRGKIFRRGKRRQYKFVLKEYYQDEQTIVPERSQVQPTNQIRSTEEDEEEEEIEVQVEQVEEEEGGFLNEDTGNNFTQFGFKDVNESFYDEGFNEEEFQNLIIIIMTKKEVFFHDEIVNRVFEKTEAGEMPYIAEVSKKVDLALIGLIEKSIVTKIEDEISVRYRLTNRENHFNGNSLMESQEENEKLTIQREIRVNTIIRSLEIDNITAHERYDVGDYEIVRTLYDGKASSSLSKEEEGSIIDDDISEMMMSNHSSECKIHEIKIFDVVTNKKEYLLMKEMDSVCELINYTFFLLNHNNITKVHSFFNDDNKTFILMEHYQHSGIEIFEYLKTRVKHEFQYIEIMNIFVEICKGIRYLLNISLDVFSLDFKDILFNFAENMFSNVAICLDVNMNRRGKDINNDDIESKNRTTLTSLREFLTKFDDHFNNLNMGTSLDTLISIIDQSTDQLMIVEELIVALQTLLNDYKRKILITESFMHQQQQQINGNVGKTPVGVSTSTTTEILNNQNEHGNLLDTII